VVRPYVPGYGTGVTAEDYLVERAKQVQKALPRAVRKSLGPVAEKHVMSMGEWSPPRFVQAAAWSLDRAGLLFADDLATALDHIKRSDPALVGFPVTTTEEAVSCLERSKAATDLVRFHLSDDHAALRRALGIADA
jgi:hypothetical protein